MWPIIDNALEHNGLITAFAVVGGIMWLSVLLSRYLTFGRVHGSAIAIVIGLVLAWVGGTLTGGQKGLADMALFSGIGLMGGPCCATSPSLPRRSRCRPPRLAVPG